jgi:hypothetical protein
MRGIVLTLCGLVVIWSVQGQAPVAFPPSAPRDPFAVLVTATSSPSYFAV